MNPKEQETNALIERIQKTIDLYKKNNKIKFSWSRLASNIGLTPQAATNWKRGILSRAALQKIADFTGVDYYWLLT
ncbi:helix-turn-helix domain-containing protein, partial [Acinetobacter variabilis]|uniref:helix-turn-helix domain-containing protein n=1 Tax=Acinetobacter variabilis TaxID=70346 RepID=UPI0035E466B5